jgi:hypothetical protein
MKNPQNLTLIKSHSSRKMIKMLQAAGRWCIIEIPAGACEQACSSDFRSFHAKREFSKIERSGVAEAGHCAIGSFLRWSSIAAVAAFG